MNRYNHTYCVIMAGGSGTRFWPLSRDNRPKQFIDILGMGRTMLQATFDRFEAIIPAANFYVLTGEKYATEVLNQLPGVHPTQVLTEPVRRNTAPALAYAAYKIFSNDPEAVMVVTSSDHYINGDAEFRNCIKQALNYAQEHEALITLGITPTYPATSYGYIEISKEVAEKGEGAVVRFKEKPDLEEAKQLVASEKYLWNSGMFIWRVKDLIKALETHLPEVAVHYAEINTYNTPSEADAVDNAFEHTPAISIDYGVMEKAENVATIKADFQWSDIGTWNSLQRFLQENKGSIPQSLKEETENFIYLEESPSTWVEMYDKKKKMVGIGLENFLVVDMEDLLFIAPKSDEEKLHANLNKYASLFKKESYEANKKDK